MTPNFLHNHPRKEKELGLDNDHVIVDREDWEQAKQIIDTQKKRIAIIGGGFQGAICGIDEAKTIFIAHEDMVRYPTLPIRDENWVQSDDPDEYLEGIKKRFSHEEFRCAVLEIRDDQLERFRKKHEDFQKSVKETALAFERIGEAMLEPSFNENKKRKGHERPYKYHR